MPGGGGAGGGGGLEAVVPGAEEPWGTVPSLLPGELPGVTAVLGAAVFDPVALAPPEPPPQPCNVANTMQTALAASTRMQTPRSSASLTSPYGDKKVQ